MEAVSSAEIVVTVRRSSGSYRDASFLVGGAAAAGTLAFGLFSPWPFSSEALFIDPCVVGVLVALGSTLVPSLRRLVTPPSERRRRVETHARANFVERSVSGTTGRTGVLVYVSILERTARVVADTGIVAAVPANEWASATERVEAAARRGKATVVASAVSALGPLLAKYLPCSADDVNELPDEVSAT